MKDGKAYVNCIIRDKEIQLKPEEVIRQLYTDKLIKTFGEPRAPRSEITKHHQDVAASLQAMLEEAEKEAVKLKNQALFWVYVIEWLAITGTAMLTGFLTWSLMVRRKLYREVKTLRFT